jgi:hypothetical protein
VASEELLEMTAAEWSQLDQEKYRALFKDSPVERAGYTKLQSTLDFLSKKA